jgi:hypothetical protein
MDSDCSHLMTGVAIWFSNLTHLLSWVWFLWDLACGFSVCLTCVGGHSFSYSMDTHEPFVRFDGLFNSFSCGLGWVCGHVSRAFLLVHNLVFVMLLLVLLILFPWDLVAFSNDCTHSFPRINISACFYGGLKYSFSNQILHLANPRDKLSTFVLHPCPGFQSIYRLTLWDLRLRHLPLSLLSHVGWRFC